MPFAQTDSDAVHRVTICYCILLSFFLSFCSPGRACGNKSLSCPALCILRVTCDRHSAMCIDWLNALLIRLGGLSQLTHLDFATLSVPSRHFLCLIARSFSPCVSSIFSSFKADSLTPPHPTPTPPNPQPAPLPPVYPLICVPSQAALMGCTMTSSSHPSCSMEAVMNQL